MLGLILSGRIAWPRDVLGLIRAAASLDPGWRVRRILATASVDPGWVARLTLPGSLLAGDGRREERGEDWGTAGRRNGDCGYCYAARL